MLQFLGEWLLQGLIEEVLSHPWARRALFALLLGCVVYFVGWSTWAFAFWAGAFLISELLASYFAPAP